MNRILTLGFIPSRVDCGLLVLRIGVCLTLFLKHGTEKLFHFSQMAAHFPDPLHIGPVPSLVFAMLGDGLCTLLIVVGLATRWAALLSFINIFIAWAFVHHFVLFGRGADHGELIVLYLVGLLTILVAGPGRYSVDAWLLSGSARKI
jgi:putative oxidoreductase